MNRFEIVIDDSDRAESPDKPWAASVYGPDGEPLADAGLGKTPQDAVRDLLASWSWPY